MDNAGVSVAYVTVNEQEVKVISNGMVDISDFVPFDAHAECGIHERVRFSVLAEILESNLRGATLKRSEEAVAGKRMSWFQNILLMMIFLLLSTI